MIYRASFLLLLILNISCGGSSEFVKNPPFKVDKTLKKAEKAGEVQVVFDVSELPADVIFKDLYFQNKKSRILWDSTATYYATFSDTKANSEDRVLSADRAQEANNPLPQVPVKPPYKISENQALLNYQVNDKAFFTILELNQ
ncbi:hypothetical protein DSM03_101595 [Leeuwenhoekiella aestuarii]|uniref:Beta-lactamase-inhibitor-like PepSY-like domain-containing protein n=1 Tax=Leeuwenhoekiella aestuarii TaxID=2249426 RepID=A0A4Q0P001_9FLAO|nr:hypothetical protein [Leeuwenhoekiella aestuarii]RXG17896.1 hypothetical protein DSM04_10180 [Leeuwenhoekiella aestuarii]RXG19225.1 hypothetical protein DSM03_101595 [Leeuwenhoekiella aestuarii]